VLQNIAKSNPDGERHMVRIRICGGPARIIFDHVNSLGGMAKISQDQVLNPETWIKRELSMETS
jgi:hypothetical protein